MGADDDLKVKSVALVLAAGSSSRLGQSKQMLEIGGETLLRKTVKTAHASGVDRVLVVTGAEHTRHQAAITDLPAQVIFHSDWSKGMGSSLKCGVHQVITNFPAVEFILILVCDQPLLSAAHLRALIAKHDETGAPLVASFYAHAPGVPALFCRSEFQKLMAVADESGAKKIILENQSLAATVPFPDGVFDIDTPEDLQKLK